MNSRSNYNSSRSNQTVYPIRKNSKTPEKCAQFAENLDAVNSSLKLTDSVVARVPFEDRA
jgi:hypothetical protein